MTRHFEYLTKPLALKEKGMAITRKDILQGIADESAQELQQLGADGWEMVAAVPFASGSHGLLSNAMKTDTVLAFLKREL